MSVVHSEDRGPIRYITLDRAAKRNALDLETVESLGNELNLAAKEASVRCVVLKGSGPVFSAGMDTKLLASLAEDPTVLIKLRERALAAWNLCEEMPKPTIAQLHGACLGGALELALACDMRVAAAGTALALPEVKFGIVPDLGGCSRLPSVVGLGRAKELIMTGRTIDAEQGERIGLVNHCVPAEQLDETVLQLAEELTALPPAGVENAKRILDAAAKPILPLTLQQEILANRLCVSGGS